MIERNVNGRIDHTAMPQLPRGVRANDNTTRKRRCLSPRALWPWDVRRWLAYFGSSTVSITWMTPFDAATSTVVTLAPLTVTPEAPATTLSD